MAKKAKKMKTPDTFSNRLRKAVGMDPLPARTVKKNPTAGYANAGAAQKKRKPKKSSKY